MRQRRVTGIEERIRPYADLILRGEGECIPPTGADEAESPHIGAGWAENPHNGADFPLRWHERPSPRYALPDGFGRVYAELGCGRGLFINKLAAEDPGGLYIGAEGCRTILIRALEKTREAGLANIRYIDSFINDAASAFAAGLLSGVFLNFSDPWPKVRHAGRRLTAPAKAAAYLGTLKPGGFVVFKTDGEEFYRYSLEVFQSEGFSIEGHGLLHFPGQPDEGAEGPCRICADAIAGRAVNTPTEYELRFRSFGSPVYYFAAYKI